MSACDRGGTSGEESLPQTSRVVLAIVGEFWERWTYRRHAGQRRTWTSHHPPCPAVSVGSHGGVVAVRVVASRRLMQRTSRDYDSLLSTCSLSLYIGTGCTSLAVGREAILSNVMYFYLLAHTPLPPRQNFTTIPPYRRTTCYYLLAGCFSFTFTSRVVSLCMSFAILQRTCSL